MTGMLEDFRALFAPGEIGPRVATMGFAAGILIGAAVAIAQRAGVI